MAEKFISDRNLKFLLYEMFDVESLLKYPRYTDHSREVFDMVMDTAMKMGKNLFKPIFSEMDKIHRGLSRVRLRCYLRYFAFRYPYVLIKSIKPCYPDL